MSRTLISRPNVEKLVRMADLDLARASAADREELIDSIVEEHQLEGNVAANLYVISYRDPEPAAGEEGRAVAAGDIRRIEPRRQAPGYADGREVSRRPDQELRAELCRPPRTGSRISSSSTWGCRRRARARTISVASRRCGNAIEAARVELQSAEQARDSYKKELAGEEPRVPAGADGIADARGRA